MKNRLFFISLAVVLITEIISVIIFLFSDTGGFQDAVAVNKVVRSVQESWEKLDTYANETELEYVVINPGEDVLFRTKTGLSESINAAVIHRDTVLDIKAGNKIAGKVIIFNNREETLQSEKRRLAMVLSLAIIIQCLICAGYIIYLQYIIINPFSKLKGFAERIAGGNLDVPLGMDRHNIFGVFTESFDIMRSELKKARIAEAKANADKKELVAKLSHDIKTPVASIKAVAETGAVLAGTYKQKENYQRIIEKAGQINTLVTNLFTSALEELDQISVNPSDIDSKDIKEMLLNADYFRRSDIPGFPGCLVYADKLRLQQVFDNIFANSYKYAGTDIKISVEKEAHSLCICIEDAGGGVKKDELPLLKEKFKRGSNTGNTEGAGLGLYISNYFMKKMNGELIVENGQYGLKVTVVISLSGY